MTSIRDGTAHAAAEFRDDAPRILLAATTRWPLAARLAMVLRGLGCSVQVWCPRQHPVDQLADIASRHHCSVLRPQHSLRRAINAAQPDLILPCDDEAVHTLVQLHARCADGDEDAAVLRTIARSLGVPAACAQASARGELMRIAAAAGARMPQTRVLDSATALEAWAREIGFPAVLKTDRSWGGQGVAVVRDLAQARAALHLVSHPSWCSALGEWILRRDPAPLLRRLQGQRPAVTIQRYIDGQAANRAVACWQGQTLAGISALVLRSRSGTGPATVVRIIDNAQMTDSALRLVETLGLSGLCGFDFVIERASGTAYLIEINPRATPVCHLPLGVDQDLPVALLNRLYERQRPLRYEPIGGAAIALFPGEWQRDPCSPFLHEAHHDVPWGECDLVRECLSPPWEERGLAARLRLWWGSRVASAPKPAALQPENTPLRSDYGSSTEGDDQRMRASLRRSQ
ncbi:ATP-grasp domain-containing protein [Sinimarinibacterium flocculans]|uniref:ATP-grasp domain-containing protein n=1 Tax=Sinimarinibacterium flocculans TaxID=985250 RepID=UPI00248F6981|nr:ATP-grasp domain-containing protein [Sinimarinibacterium flocculans]